MHEERGAEGHQGTLGVTHTLIFKCSDGDTDACLKLSTLMKVYTSKYVSPSRGCEVERGEYGPCYCSNDGARGSAGLVGGGGEVVSSISYMDVWLLCCTPATNIK